MITIEQQIAKRNLIRKGLEKAFERLIEFKKEKNSVLVIMRNNKIVEISPFNLDIEHNK